MTIIRPWRETIKWHSVKIYIAIGAVSVLDVALNWVADADIIPRWLCGLAVAVLAIIGWRVRNVKQDDGDGAKATS